MAKRELQLIVHKIDDHQKALKEFEKKCEEGSQKAKDIILNYPTVYLHNWRTKNLYEVYIGETNDIIQRTKQHYSEAKNSDSWQAEMLEKDAKLYIIGYEHFNKSMTLDVENRLMMYLMSVEQIRKIHNQRGNPQKKYYPDYEFEGVFHKIWSTLRKKDPELFPAESRIRESAIFRASPLHKLTLDQEQAKEYMIQKVLSAVENTQERQLIFIEGEAGTGKTVLNSSTFYELYLLAEERKLDHFQCRLIVNHDEQIRVYQQIADKLGITEKYGDVVSKPTRFINRHTEQEPIDVAFIDEAHLLLTQGKQAYRGKNQLEDIIKRAKVVVIMFDENQILTTEQYWEEQILDRYRNLAKKAGNYIELKDQLRIFADPGTIEWIDALTKDQMIREIPQDTKQYEIKIFDSPSKLEEAIKEKARTEDGALSRMVATYDWEYNRKKAPTERLKNYWEVLINDWHKPWNYQLEKGLDRHKKKKIKELSWAEQPQTIDEIGSTFTVQGFDLNYVGVILGPSVKYRNGRVIFDPEASANKKAKQNRTLSDGRRKKFGEKLIQHEVRVLMTRGVNGLYIYACDDELRKALVRAANQNESQERINE